MNTAKFRAVSHGISGIPDSTVIIAILDNYPTRIAVESLERLTGWSAARIGRAVPDGWFHKVPAEINGTREARNMKFVNAGNFARQAYGKINYGLCVWIAQLGEDTRKGE